MTAHRIPPEELLDFPTDFAFKAVGHHTRQFGVSVHKAVAEALGDDRPVALRTRLSRQGTYLSATCTTRVDSADELTRVYAALRAVEGILTVL